MIRSAFAAALIGVMAVNASSADAGTVKYYTRQKLANLSTAPAYTYTPTYGAYGACSGGSQSASVSTCTRSDHVSVATSFCSPASISQACSAAVITCASYGSGLCHTGASLASSTATGTAGATSFCQNYMQTNGITSGTCSWVNDVNHMVTVSSGTTSSGCASYVYTAICKSN